MAENVFVLLGYLRDNGLLHLFAVRCNQVEVSRFGIAMTFGEQLLSVVEHLQRTEVSPFVGQLNYLLLMCNGIQVLCGVPYTNEVNHGILCVAPAEVIDIRIERLGKEMLTWIILPPNFDKTKKYPTLLFCEGGPQSPVSQFWSYRWNFMIMASQGYVVVAPNRRGLPGFGQEWLEEISGDWTGQCIKDYLAAIDDAAENLPYVDKDHLGAVGASFGGFSVYYLAGVHEKRFKAFIAHDGAFNLAAMYTETEENWFSNWEYDEAYWHRPQLPNAKETYHNSPHKMVEKWDTPILCIHGEKDYRINATQGMSAFNAARMKGIPAELLIFPDENHWVLKPQNGVLWQRTFFNWLDRWLKVSDK